MAERVQQRVLESQQVKPTPGQELRAQVVVISAFRVQIRYEGYMKLWPVCVHTPHSY